MNVHLDSEELSDQTPRSESKAIGVEERVGEWPPLDAILVLPECKNLEK